MSDELVSNRNKLDNIFKDKSNLIKRRSEIYGIIPELKVCGRFDQCNNFYMKDLMSHNLKTVRGCNSNDFSLNLAALLHDIGKPYTLIKGNDGMGHCYGHGYYGAELVARKIIGRRVFLSKVEAQEVYRLIYMHESVDWIPDKEYLKGLCKETSLAFIIKLWKLSYSNFLAHVKPNPTKIRDFKACKEILTEIYNEESIITRKRLKINGNDLKKLFGVQEGKSIGIILDNLVLAVNRGLVKNNFDDLVNYLKKVA